MKFLVKSVVAATLVFGLMSVNAPSADAGLFAKLFKKKCGCCEPAPEPACCASIYSLPQLAEGEILISISPIAIPSGAIVSTSPAKPIPMKPVTLVAVRSSTIR